MPMIEMPVTPVAAAEVVIERRAGEMGNRGLSPVVAVVGVPPVLLLTQASPVGTSAYAESFKMRCRDVARIVPGEEAFADQPGLYDSSRQIAFVHVVLDRLGYKDVGGHYVNLPEQVLKDIKSGVAENPKHGKLTARSQNGYDYKPSSGYLGRDRIVFWVEVAGKRYRVIQDLAVVEGIADNTPPGCVTGKFKVSGIGWGLAPLTTNTASINGRQT